MLRKQVSILDRAYGGSPHLTYSDNDPPELPMAARTVVFRVAQEALHNAVRHAKATEVRVTLQATTTSSVRLEVADDGRGFDVEPTLRAGRSLGLRSMRERACAVRATLKVTSTPGQGTTVTLEVPHA